MTLKEEARKLTARQREGRAINAVADLLRRRLSVPNIYLEPPVTVIPADVLAVDRGGAGDLHAVEIELSTALAAAAPRPSPALQDQVKSAHRQLMSMPAHFRYLAISAENLRGLQKELSNLGLYAEDGIGRLGIITITEKESDPPIAEIAFAPERFRLEPAKLKAIETRLLSKSRPDIEVRI